MRRDQENRDQEKNFWNSKDVFQQLAENIDEGFWMTDPRKKKLFYLSPAYLKIWGRPLKTLLQKPKAFLKFVHPDDRARVTRALRKQTLGKYNEEYRIILPDGSIRWIRDRAFPIRVYDGCFFSVGFLVL